MWEALFAQEWSGDPARADLAEIPHLRHWVVLREVRHLLQAAVFEDIPAAATRYVQDMSPGYIDSLRLELMRNDMRDDERRHARHGQRSDLSDAAMCMSSAATRYPEARQVRPVQERGGHFHGAHVASSIARTAPAPRASAGLDVESELLERSGIMWWPSPN